MSPRPTCSPPTPDPTLPEAAQDPEHSLGLQNDDGRDEGRDEAPAEWLLDGFNVLHATLFTDQDRTDWWAEKHRERLISRVGRFSEKAEAIWIAFDGERASDPDARRIRTAAGVPIYLVFAPSADDWLVARVRESDAPERIAVVTRDRRVGGRARHRGARVVAPNGFLARCPET